TSAPGVAGGGRGGCGCERTNSSSDDESSCSGVRDSSDSGRRLREDPATPAAWRSTSTSSAPAPATAPRQGAASPQATAGWGEDRQRSSAPPSWLDAGVFLRGVSALHLRGGVRAMSAAAA
ncbi:unnamed protein product, partial [Ectocarpus fasciculatus]